MCIHLLWYNQVMLCPLFRNVRIIGATPKFASSVMGLTEAVLLMERAPAAVGLNIHFVSPHRMHQLNLEHRGVDQPTDVLTFPGSGSGTPGSKFLSEIILSEHDDCCASSNVDPSALARRRIVLQELGDIYFSVGYIWARCVRRPNRCLPFRDYLEAALSHALLHALGYDHDTPEKLSKMARREKFIKQRLSAWQRRCPTCLRELDGVEMLTSRKTTNESSC
uniref:Uncharacterized protein TCIL3000_4_930 n=1 Tax=Trypanosoma congolense (strain IL3000) TaxID=1068625 RepID=G0UKV4_TRYCI|nr:unnamed protein product [Trypanosoma congolense IL3000]